jgi:hypothetical protein
MIDLRSLLPFWVAASHSLAGVVDISPSLHFQAGPENWAQSEPQPGSQCPGMQQRHTIRIVSFNQNQTNTMGLFSTVLL